MSLARFLDPVSDDQPCGPDLLEADDDAFIDYYYDAIDRLPARFFQDGKPFERNAIAFDAERSAVEALLARSRDLRPLAVLAQFAALAGRLPDLAEIADCMAGLLEAYPDAVHPGTADSIEERQNTLELLDSQTTMVLALEHAVLAEDKRLQGLTFRAYAVGSGLRGDRETEAAGDPSAITAALGAEPNAAQVDASHAALSTLQAALKRMEAACLTADARPFRPRFERLHPLLAEMLGLIAAARPDLNAAAEPATADAPAADTDPAGDAGGGAPAATPMAAAPAPSGRVRTHAEASAALAAIEGYFTRMEPSSPALVLVRQARQLVGQPLIRALELLLGDGAADARIDLAPDTGLTLGADRLRALSDLPEPEPHPSEPLPNAAPTPDFPATTRPEATALMQAVEGFYRATEPSSPIPMLLFKARASLNRDFTALLADLLPPAEPPKK